MRSIKRNQAIQTNGRDALRTEVNIKAQQEQGPRLQGAFQAGLQGR